MQAEKATKVLGYNATGKVFGRKRFRKPQAAANERAENAIEKAIRIFREGKREERLR
ncbi:MAG: hypothetical protein LBE56_12325 [Tannerella sp.]|nr:hypothetical protein [Tannerella sp.]